MAAIDDLTGAVSKLTSEVGIAVSAFKDVSDKLAAALAAGANGVDPAAVEAAVSQINASTDALSAAFPQPAPSV